MTTYTLFSNLILYIVSILNTSFLLEIKPKKKLWPIIVGMPLFLLTGYISAPLRLIVQFIILLVIINCFFLKDTKKIISAITFNYFVSMLTELTIMCFLFLTLEEVFLAQQLDYFISCIWGLFSYIAIRQKMFIQFWNIIKSRIKEYLYMILTLALTTCYISIIDRNTINSNNLIFYLLFILIFMTILFDLIKKTIERNKIEQQINELTKFMKVYEQEIEKQIISQHEYKNMLICIKTMIKENNDEAIKLIDNFLEESINKNYNVLKEVQKLNIKSLKGLLYYKICYCKENGINSVLNVDSKIKNEKIKKVDITTIKNLSTILGILLDNAIEACLETDSKSLSIYIYEEKEKLVFQISNTFKGTINIDFIYKKGYPVKRKEHGHGLLFVKYKLKESQRLNLRTEINNDIFIQYLELDLKK